MPHQYTYELWNGKKVVGTVTMFTEACGKYMIFCEQSILKQMYSRKTKEIKVPIAYRFISDDGVDHVMRKVLDVRKKSKRQIEIIKGYDRKSYLKD